MKILFESDRECTIDGVGLLEPGKEVEVNSETFFQFHGIKPGEANFPDFITITFDVSEGRRLP